jgi:uncharacterized membrane protein
MDRVEIVTGQTGALSPDQETKMDPQAQPQAEPTENQQPAAEPQVEETPQDKPEVDAETQVNEIEQKLGTYSQEFFTNGKLSDESYQDLNKLGFSKAIVDQFIAGQQAVMAREEQAVYDSVGGKDTYAAMVQWAGQNLSKDEIDAYNSALSSGNQAQMQFAVKGLQARFAANTREPSLKTAGGKAPPASFRSVAEVVAAMSDPKYKTDPAYRAEVERKVANSNVL